MNLSEQVGETTRFTEIDYLDSWRTPFSHISLDAIIFDLGQTEGQGSASGQRRVWERKPLGLG